MKRSNRLVILVGVLLAVLAFVGIVVLLQSPRGGGGGPEEPTTVPVLVAIEDINIGDPVLPDMVQVRQVDPSAVLGTRFGDPSQLIGRPALIPVPAGGQVNEEVVGTTPNICISCQLLPGEKAIAFQVDRVTGLDFLIQAGDHVDIVYGLTLQVLQPAENSTDEFPRWEPVPGLEEAPTVKVLLQDKRVLYVSASRIRSLTQTTPTPSPAQGQQAEQPQIETVVIVIAGTDADAEVIKFAQNDQSIIGPLTAILRATEDTAIEVTEGVTLNLLVERFGIPIPFIVQVEIPSPSPTP